MTSVRMRAWAMLAVAVLIAGCGGVGEIIDSSPVADKNGDQNFDDVLEEKDRLTTATQGQFIFTMKEDIERCTQNADSILVVRPSDAVALKVEHAPEGSPVYCGTKENPGKWSIETDQSVLSGEDPVFSISSENGVTIVKVVFGRVNVASIATGDSVLVEAMQQTLVAADLPPIDPFPIDLSDLDLRFFGEWDVFDASRGPIVPVDPLDGAGRVAEAIERDVLVIAFEPAVEETPAALELVDSLAAELSTVLGVEVRLVAATDPVGEFEQGAVDLIVTPDPAGETVPFMLAPDGREFFLASPGDAEFAVAFGEFYRSFIDAGRYRAAFDRVGIDASYDLFEDLAAP